MSMPNSTTAGDTAAGQSYTIQVHRLAHRVLRLTLVILFLAFGYVKFFPFEADGVEPLIAAHPALNWLLPMFGKAGASAFLGVVEITAGIALLVGFRSALANLVGGVLTLVTFAITVSLFFFIPGVFEESAGGFPAISGTGGFLSKDTVLFAAGLVFAEQGYRDLRQHAEARRPQFLDA
jgi:reactive chlorine resistance protein C